MPVFSQTKVPLVGIFWILPGDSEIIGVGEPLTDGDKVLLEGGNYLLMYHYTHDEAWVIYQDKYPEVRSRTFPRGRVMYNNENKTFYIMLNRHYLKNENIISMVKSFFNLRGRIATVTSEHYDM